MTDSVHEQLRELVGRPATDVVAALRELRLLPSADDQETQLLAAEYVASDRDRRSARAHLEPRLPSEVEGATGASLYAGLSDLNTRTFPSTLRLLSYPSVRTLSGTTTCRRPTGPGWPKMKTRPSASWPNSPGYAFKTSSWRGSRTPGTARDSRQVTARRYEPSRLPERPSADLVGCGAMWTAMLAVPIWTLCAPTNRCRHRRSAYLLASPAGLRRAIGCDPHSFDERTSSRSMKSRTRQRLLCLA